MNLSQRLAVRDSVTHLLEESPTLEDAARGALETVCESLNWEWGALWIDGTRADVLRCVATWHAPSSRFPEFEAASRESTVERGVGLPGRVWADARPAWIEDVGGAPTFPRAAIAAGEGLHAAFGFPILLGGAVLGVMEFFSREIRQPDADLLQMLGSVGSQIGQFLERRRAERDRERLPGLRILLAEDSPDNVLLIQSYLKASGCTADVAGNGEVAFQTFISGIYDVVLMDVQMPVMDGYAATRRIRQWEGEHGATPVPILALTAHALPEEVRKSLDAGCTAHLTKPVRKTTLLRAIEEHTTRAARMDAGLATLVPGFLENRRRDLDAIASALARSDYENVRILGHNMKGSGAGYGFNRITEIGAFLEQAAGRREPGEIRARAAELCRYLDGLAASA